MCCQTRDPHYSPCVSELDYHFSSLCADLRCLIVSEPPTKSSLSTHPLYSISSGLIYTPQLRGGKCVSSLRHVPATATDNCVCVCVCPSACESVLSHDNLVILPNKVVACFASGMHLYMCDVSVCVCVCEGRETV